LDVVLPTGEMITTGSQNSRARQSSSGLELTKIFVGAEGILGIITRLRLKVMPIPASRAIVLALFDQLEKAGEAVVATFQAGIMPAATEILDQNTLRAVNLYRPGMNLPEVEAMLLFEVDGNHEGAVRDAESICKAVEHLAISTEWADDPKRIAALWEARSVVGAAAGTLRPNSFRAYIGEDLCVPSVRVPEALREIANIAKKYDIPVATYGHIGGGGIHPALLINPFSEDEIRRVQKCADEFHQLALRMGGSVTGEHGVGLARAPYMDLEHGPAMATMKAIKMALDPKGIMNPGKLFPAEIPDSAKIGAPLPPLGVFGEQDLPADLATMEGIDPG
jgi:glycolate oxidase